MDESVGNEVGTAVAVSMGVDNDEHANITRITIKPEIVLTDNKLDVWFNILHLYGVAVTPALYLSANS